MYVGDLEIQTLGGEKLTLKEAAERAGFSGEFYIDVWGYWCGPCLRIKPLLKSFDVLYLHLSKGDSHTEIRTVNPYEPTKADFACVSTTADKLKVRGIPFIKKVDKDFMLSETRYYPGLEGMREFTA